MMINKRCCKIAVWFSCIFSIFFWHSIGFPQINSSITTKIFNVFFSCKKCEIILKYSWRKIFCTIKNLISISEIFSSFVDIAFIFSNSSFSSFSRSMCFVLFEVTFLFEFFSISSKFVFFTKLEISPFAC